MESLSGLGIFLGGLGIFFVSCGLFWWVSLYEKKNFPKDRKENK